MTAKARKIPVDVLMRISYDKELSKYIVMRERGQPLEIDYISTPVEDFINDIRKACKSTVYYGVNDWQEFELVNPIVKSDLEYGSYGDSDRMRYWIEGVRLASQEEIDAYIPWKEEKDSKDAATKKKQKENEAIQAKVKKEKEDAKALERAKKSYPELFKDNNK